MEKQWVVYILQCRDDTLYSGITDDLQRRLDAHRSGRGAKYTKGRGPFVLRYVEQCINHSAALKREFAIKQLTRTEKLELCRTAEVLQKSIDQHTKKSVSN